MPSAAARRSGGVPDDTRSWSNGTRQTDGIIAADADPTRPSGRADCAPARTQTAGQPRSTVACPSPPGPPRMTAYRPQETMCPRRSRSPTTAPATVIEIPIDRGGVDAKDWEKLLPGVWFHDPSFGVNLGHGIRITELDGANGILRYRGYPIDQLAEQSSYLEVAYLLIHGDLPTAQQFEAWRYEITHHTFIHENVRKRFMEGFHHDAHPMGILDLHGGRAVHLLPERQGHRGPRRPHEAGRAPHRQDAHPRRGRLSPQRRHAVRLPRQQPRLRRQLPVDDVEDRRAPLRRQPGAGQSTRRVVHPPCRPRAELLHHRHAHRRFVPRRPLHLDRSSRRRPLRSPPRRRQRSRHQDAQRDRLAPTTWRPTSRR